MSFNNEIRLVGNITKDPVMRKSNTNQVSVTNITVATNESFKRKNSDTYETETQFHPVVVWGERAEFVQRNFRKGDGIKVRGRLIYKTREVGDEKVQQAEIEALEIDFGERTRAQWEAFIKNEASETTSSAGQQTNEDDVNRMATDAAR